MYRFDFEPDFLKELGIRDNKNPGISNKLAILEENPISIAIATNIPAIGEFYINASNNYAILFDIDEEKKELKLYSIIHKSKLYKILNKQISPD